MAFAQLSGCTSLRQIETCLAAMQPKLYHSGFRSAVVRSTLADANERRDWRIYFDFAQVLIRIARPLYRADDFSIELDQTTYALDSTTVELCLSLFPWAHYRHDHGAVKLHTLIDLRGSIPCWIYVSDGRFSDVDALDRLGPESGALYIMDRGYIDFARLAVFTMSLSYFIIRARRDLAYSRRAYRPVDHATGLRSDQTITLRWHESAERYPYPLRYVRYYDSEHNRKLVLLTNNFRLDALKVPQFYKCRWQVELFFRWIKQHLRITAFLGTSWNAVKTQIWIAISVYVLIAIARKHFGITRSMYEIQQILSISLFEQVPIYQVLTAEFPQPTISRPCKQLSLFDL
jgi:IS4 transposase